MLIIKERMGRKFGVKAKISIENKDVSIKGVLLQTPQQRPKYWL
jgi:hypothetical protein